MSHGDSEPLTDFALSGTSSSHNNADIGLLYRDLTSGSIDDVAEATDSESQNAHRSVSETDVDLINERDNVAADIPLPSCSLKSDFLVSEPTPSSTTTGNPLQKIEEFISKTMAKKTVARRNIRTLKSLRDLNPETRRVMDEENERMDQIESSGIPNREESPDIEIISVQTPRRFENTEPSTSNGEVVCLEVKDKFRSVTSFHCDDSENVPDVDGRILINTNRMKKDPQIFVADHLAPHLKKHQVGGVRFMYATLIESSTKFTNSSGHGSVLAHSMGLGKTLQVITFLEAVFRHVNDLKTVLIVAPLNTMAHWMAEIAKWMPEEKRSDRFVVTCLKDQKEVVRNSLIEKWATDGGILLIGYEKLRSIANVGKRPKSERGGKRQKVGKVSTDDMTPSTSAGVPSALESLSTAVSDPADEKNNEISRLLLNSAQVVICDEGHRIKSADAAVTRVLKKVKTRRRLILTGYPLQNNLLEYWCMIDFVRPYLLGTESEFINLFKNPIENGQCADSSDADQNIMRERTYILQRTLSRIVQRRDSRPLIEALPQKREFALIFRQTPSQSSLYRSLCQELAMNRDSLNAVALYSTFRNIASHPAIFFQHLKKLADQVNDPKTAVETGPIRTLLASFVRKGIWKRHLDNLEANKYDEIHSGKIMFLKHLVQESVVKGKEKIVIFSQSIDVLDYLEGFLQTLLPPPPENEAHFPPFLRIDGSTSSSEREVLINQFNNKEHGTRLFLISTEAGGIGINLTGGQKIVLMDVSWNPSKDIQAISRIYRYGQECISTIYRLVGDGSMEKCVFERQINKQCLFKRVVDDKNPMLAVNQSELSSLFRLDEEDGPDQWHQVCQEPFPDEAKADDILRQLDDSLAFRQYLAKAPQVMDSILEADDMTQLSADERQRAEARFLREKQFGPGSRIENNNGFMPVPPRNGNHVPQFLPQRPVPPIPSVVQLPLESFIPDAEIVKEIAEVGGRNEDLSDVIRKLSEKYKMRAVRHQIPNRAGGLSSAHILYPPSMPFGILIRPDGTAYRVNSPLQRTQPLSEQTPTQPKEYVVL